ncbi:hypothetical protein L917_19651 [Phytophthora nicotianae]|uniref:Uncharacterized protein n=2 Tax=Phytophthora nicotianae TaxID=4792 RepID=W2K3M9_PHYNI|nr:hypothetical protein L917_19651 [Phytophthora nicotianae]
MSRSANTVSLCYNHMEWGEDALKVFFAHMKNDQRGTRPRDPRHIYANPLMPEVCPILALGLDWMVYGVDSNANQVFPGNDQYDRFRKTLRRALETPGLANELERVGVRCDDIGTHSMRKGAATYCSSGSTACPPAIAVHLRAGWALGGVQDRYLRHDSAGDMFVGRTVSGLPILKAGFATLPPRFKGGRDQVEVAKRICFRGLPRNVTLIAEYALASIIYHYAYLKEHLPEEHPLLQAPLMRNEQRIQDLRTFVVCGETSSEETVTATGISPHVVLLSEIQFLKNTVELQRLEQKNVAREVIDGVRLVLEEAADQRGTPSCSRIATTVLDCLKEGGYLHQHPDPQEQAEPEAVTDSTHSTNATFPLHTWGGGFHAFPEGMTLPEGTAEQAWVFWCCEDPSRSLPPYRRLKNADLSDNKQKKRLSDLKFLMNLVEQQAVTLHIDTRSLTAEEAVSVFRRCEGVLAVPEVTAKARKRRSSQLVWQTVTSIMRKKVRGAVL